MVIFLLDESTVIGKGGNCVINLIDYFDNFGLKEAFAHLHADNCSGQDKNNTMIQYFLWHNRTGWHQGVKLSFLLAGYTKFAPDAMFGLFQKKFPFSKMDCLEDIKNIVKIPSPAVFSFLSCVVMKVGML